MPNINIRCEETLKTSVNKLAEADGRDEAGYVRKVLTDHCVKNDPLFRALHLRASHTPGAASIAAERLKQIAATQEELDREATILNEVAASAESTTKGTSPAGLTATGQYPGTPPPTKTRRKSKKNRLDV